MLSAADAIALGVTGPAAARFRRGLRCAARYAVLQLREVSVQAVPVSDGCDVWARYIVRHAGDARECEDLPAGAWTACPRDRIVADAPKIILPDREQMKTQMESLIHHFKIVTEGFQVPAGEVTSSVEAPHGMMNYYVVSDGTAKPYRVHMRNPGFADAAGVGDDVQGTPDRGCGRSDWQQLILCLGRLTVSPSLHTELWTSWASLPSQLRSRSRTEQYAARRRRGKCGPDHPPRRKSLASLYRNGDATQRYRAAVSLRADRGWQRDDRWRWRERRDGPRGRAAGARDDAGAAVS